MMNLVHQSCIENAFNCARTGIFNREVLVALYWNRNARCDIYLLLECWVDNLVRTKEFLVGSSNSWIFSC